jgi:catechol 2,3-dioxygenase-like lactoylglutathione lyase family enzyme
MKRGFLCVRMLQSIPALPVGDIKKSIGFYCDKLGFTLVHHEDGFAVLMCNEVRIHLWEASDEGWRSRSNDSPVCTGAESFIAGTASCRIEVEGIDELYQHIKPLGILHPNTSLKDQWWDERDFAVIDPDNNLISFFQQIKAKSIINLFSNRARLLNKRYERPLLYLFFILSGFVRYTRKPKDNKILFLLSLAFGKLDKTDKIKIGKGLKVEIF